MAPELENLSVCIGTDLNKFKVCNVNLVNVLSQTDAWAQSIDSTHRRLVRHNIRNIIKNSQWNS